MKAYIEKTIIIQNDGSCESWDDLCELFDKFNEVFVIQNTRDEKAIQISPQKINLKEGNMTEFLSILQDCEMSIGITTNTDFTKWIYHCDTDHITVSIC